jgi:uncharacterized protein YndB with AHSA1/START domain
MSISLRFGRYRVSPVPATGLLCRKFRQPEGCVFDDNRRILSATEGLHMTDTDRIVKSLVLRAARERVWHAISDAVEFGSWFGIEFDRPFSVGVRLTGRIVPTTADADVAKAQARYAGTPVEIWIERIEPPRLFAFRWHPYAVEPGIDYAAEATTLVEFELADAAAGTRVIITESGFDRIPLSRRADAFMRNEQGWTMQTTLLEQFLRSRA